MPRARLIKPEFLTDSKTGTLSDGAKSLFVGLLIHADDYGVIRNDPAELKAKIFPFAETGPATCISKPLGAELIARGLVRVFTVAGASYLFVVNFPRHQRIDHYSRPLIDGWKRGDTPESFSGANGGKAGTLREDSTSSPRALAESSTTTRSEVSELREVSEIKNLTVACGNGGNVENPEHLVPFRCSSRNTVDNSEHRMPGSMDPEARRELLKKQIQNLNDGRIGRKGPTASHAHEAPKAQAT